MDNGSRTPGWFLCGLMRHESGDMDKDELTYDPVVAWEIETVTTPRGRVRIAHPITLEPEDHSYDRVLKSPDGQFICPCYCRFETAAGVIAYQQQHSQQSLVTVPDGITMQ